MPSTHHIHGKIINANVSVVNDERPTFCLDAAVDLRSPNEYNVARVVWFPAMEDLPDLIDRLRHVSDQLAAIYYNRTAPVARGLAVPFDPLLPPVPDEEEGSSRCPAYPSHGAGQCPDCPSPEDESDPDEGLTYEDMGYPAR